MKIIFADRYKFWMLLTIFLPIAIGVTSCVSKKKIVYFQNTEQISSSDTVKNYTPVFHSDDLLSITVSGMDVDAVKPFNSPATAGIPSPSGYLIDANGMINFPVLGMIKLAGMDRMKATALITEKLKEYIANPIVNIRILNFKITVLGEVKNPGTFTIPNERITLPEALGLSGDMNITAVRKNVLVIREADGKKTFTRVDMTSKEIFSSPAYYLNQNDVVYVEPNKAKINSSANNANAGVFISVASLLIAVFTLITIK